MKVVINSTPLIALSIVNKLTLHKDIFDEIYVPEAVYDEVVIQGKGLSGADEVKSAHWIIIKKLRDKITLDPAFVGLDRGEVEVLLLAQEISADWVIMDERLARQVGKTIRLQVKGTLGILLTGYYAGLISQDEALQAVLPVEE